LGSGAKMGYDSETEMRVRLGDTAAAAAPGIWDDDDGDEDSEVGKERVFRGVGGLRTVKMVST